MGLQVLQPLSLAIHGVSVALTAGEVVAAAVVVVAAVGSPTLVES